VLALARAGLTTRVYKRSDYLRALGGPTEDAGARVVGVATVHEDHRAEERTGARPQVCGLRRVGTPVRGAHGSVGRVHGETLERDVGRGPEVEAAAVDGLLAGVAGERVAAATKLHEVRAGVGPAVQAADLTRLEVVDEGLHVPAAGEGLGAGYAGFADAGVEVRRTVSPRALVHYRTVDDAADEDEGAEDKPHGKKTHDPHRQLFFETPWQQRHSR
jgi:hypothetical protein